MPVRKLLLFAIALMIVTGGAAIADDEMREEPSVRPHVALDVGPSGPPSAEVVRRAEALVAKIVSIREGRPGLTAWSGGGPYFEPTDTGPGSARPPTDEGDVACRAIVALGPAAMPVLLARLDDPTPTGLVIEHSGGFGLMWTSTEVPVNPALADEVRTVGKALGLSEAALRDPESVRDDKFSRSITSHRATVGDVCFSLLGQITNRGYEAIRYQPTACIVVNSPTRDPRIARAVRAQWAGSDLRRELARRLDADLWTADVSWASTGAFVRLRAWYPDSVEGLFVQLLDAVEPADGRSSPPDLPSGIDARFLVEQTRTSTRPPVHAALTRLARRTRDAGVARDALERLPDLREPALHDHIVSVIHDAVREAGALGDVEALLGEIETRWPDRYPADLRRLIKGHGIEGVYVLVAIAHRKGAPLPVDAWRPLLEVRAWATEYRQSPPTPLERLRVCDVAAGQIARLRPDLPFDETGETSARERQIEAMRTALDAEEKDPKGEGK